jgi:hypothetical protein
MANERSSKVLNEGINAIHSGTFGSYFALRYFLPMYDPRIDDDVHDLTQATTSGNGVEVYPLSASLEDVTITYSGLKGEKLFNADSSYWQNHLGVGSNNIYTISDTRDYVVSASTNIANCGYGYSGGFTGYTSASISGTSYEQGVRVNIINGTSALSSILSGTDMNADGDGDFTGNNIAYIPKVSEPSFALLGGTNVSATSMLYPVASFARVAVSGNDIDAGRYSIRLTAEHGNYRFNKFVLFAVKVNSDGTEDTNVLPVPFSVHVFEGTITKQKTTDDGSGLLWEGVIQLTFGRSPALTNLTNLMVTNWVDLGTSAFELGTSDKVIIFDGAQGAPTSGESKAKLTIIDDEYQQLALGYSNSAYSHVCTCADGTLELSANSGMTVVKDKLLINDPSLATLKLLIGKDLTLPSQFGVSAQAELNIRAPSGITLRNNAVCSELLTVSKNLTVVSACTITKELDVGASNVTFNQTALTHKFRIQGSGSQCEFFDQGTGNFMISASNDLNISAVGSVICYSPSYFSKNVSITKDLDVGTSNVTFNQTALTHKFIINGSGSQCEFLDWGTGNFLISASTSLHISAVSNITHYSSSYFNKSVGFNDPVTFSDNIMIAAYPKTIGPSTCADAMFMDAYGNVSIDALLRCGADGNVGNGLSVGSSSVPIFKIRNDGNKRGLYMREATTVLTPEASYGVVFTSADGNLYYMNESGVFYSIDKTPI